MQKEPGIWQFIARRLKRQQDVVLLVVAESIGSSPGRQGFKMAVADDELFGSIGGGVMEVALVEQAKSFLSSGEWSVAGVQNKNRSGEFSNSSLSTRHSILINQVHRSNSTNTSGMICSGEQTIILLTLGSGDHETVQKVLDTIENNEARTIKISNVRFDILDSVSDEPDCRFKQKGSGEFLYEERLGCKNKLFVVGGGHCGLALTELMSKMDFHISLFDDRPDLNTLEKNKFAHKKQIIKSYESIDEYVSSGDRHFVVVMTLGYRFDEIVIRKLIYKDFKYFGVLGSKAKMAVLLKEFENEGIESNRLSKISAPVGLEINSKTPAEIAVSIAAEIIAVKNSKR